MTASKARDDEPFDFNLDAVQIDNSLRPFRFHYGGKRWTMAHRETLDKLPLLEAAERGGDAEATIVSLRMALGDQWSEFRKLGLKGPRLEKLSEAYNEFCGTEPGESSGSTDS